MGATVNPASCGIKIAQLDADGKMDQFKHPFRIVYKMFFYILCKYIEKYHHLERTELKYLT